MRTNVRGSWVTRTRHLCGSRGDSLPVTQRENGDAVVASQVEDGLSSLSGVSGSPSLRLPQTLLLELVAEFCFLQPHVPRLRPQGQCHSSTHTPTSPLPSLQEGLSSQAPAGHQPTPKLHPPDPAGGLTVSSTFWKISWASSKSQISSLHSRSRLLARSSSRKVLARLRSRSTWWACWLLENTESV